MAHDTAKATEKKCTETVNFFYTYIQVKTLVFHSLDILKHKFSSEIGTNRKK